MKATEILVAEHRIIERVLECLDRMAAEAASGAALDVQSAQDAIEFLRTFADRCHHSKEEQHLFETLRTKGWSRDAGPVAVMLLEHEEGRTLIRRMDAACQAVQAGDTRAGLEFGAAARSYVDLLRAHIHKENVILFPAADRALSAAEQDALLAAFEETERRDIGSETHEHMLAVARELTGRWGLPAPDPEAAACCGHHH